MDPLEMEVGKMGQTVTAILRRAEFRNVDGGRCLVGNIYHDAGGLFGQARFRDGALVRTSRVQKVEQWGTTWVVTTENSVYRVKGWKRGHRPRPGTGRVEP